MSYAKKGPNSDVYVFLNGADDKFDCYDCELTNQTEKFDSAGAMIDHLEEHLEEGHKVPTETMHRLTSHIKRNERVTVYLCAWIEVEETLLDEKGAIKIAERPVVKTIGVFSEPEPSKIVSQGLWAKILERDGENYEVAMRDLESVTKQWYPWLFDHIDWDRGMMKVNGA